MVDRSYLLTILPPLFFLLAFVLVPLLFVLYASFQTGSPLAPGEFSFSSIQRAYTSIPSLLAVKNTLVLGAIVAGISTLLGTCFAWITTRTDTPHLTILNSLVILPMLISPFSGLIAWIVLLSPTSGMLNFLLASIGLNISLDIFSFYGIVMVLCFYYVPYAYLYTASALKSMDPSIEEASYIVGAGKVRTLFFVTLPLVMPAILAAFILTFIFSSAVFSVPGILGARTGFFTLSFSVYSAINFYPHDFALAAAQGSFLMLLCLAGMFVYRRSTKFSERFVTITPRGYRPGIIRLAHWKYVAFALVFIYVTLSVFLPYSALIAGSVVRFFSSPNQLFATLTLENWARVLNAPDIWNALQSTLLISTIGSVISVSLGFALAYGILKTEAKGRRILDYLAMAPIGVPGLVFSMGMIWAYIRTPIYATIWILILTMVVGTIPNTLRILSSNLLQLSKEHEECSRICGASVLSTIKNIVIPLMKPAILSAFVITFIMLSRELSAAIFLSTASTRPLSVLTWDYLESGEWNMACVLGLIQAAIVLCMLSVFQMLFKTRVISEIR